MLKFGLSPFKTPTSFSRGGWINSTFVHGFTDPVSKADQLLLWDIRKADRPTHELGHVATHCVCWKGGQEVIVTGGHHVSFLNL